MTQRYLLCALFIIVQALASIANAAPSIPVPISPLGDVSINSPEFVWEDQDDATEFREFKR